MTGILSIGGRPGKWHEDRDQSYTARPNLYNALHSTNSSRSIGLKTYLEVDMGSECSRSIDCNSLIWFQPLITTRSWINYGITNMASEDSFHAVIQAVKITVGKKQKMAFFLTWWWSHLYSFLTKAVYIQKELHFLVIVFSCSCSCFCFSCSCFSHCCFFVVLIFLVPNAGHSYKKTSWHSVSYLTEAILVLWYEAC